MDFALKFLCDSPGTIILMTIMAATSIMAFYRRKLFFRFYLHPYSIARQSEFYRLLTADFVHNDLVHLFVNEMLLYTTGSAFEDQLRHASRIGSIIFFAVFLLISFSAGLVILFKHYDDFDYATAGASGTILGCMAAFMIIRPEYTAFILPGIGGIKNIYTLLLFIIVLLVYTYRSKNPMVNSELHFYGLLAGVVFGVILDRFIFKMPGLPGI